MYEIIKHIAVLGRRGVNDPTTVELNLVSWDGREPNLDLRRWDENHEPLKGITLFPEEADALLLHLGDYLRNSK